MTDRVSKKVRNRAAWRGAACLAGLALISACSHQAPVTTQAPAISPPQEAAIYLSHAHASYAPPGPPEDPWGPYIREASHRFDVPDAWIREVMNVESGGYQYRANGELTTSPVGAMGLMQLMPETYDEMKVRYSLTDDAFDPHNNILAGTAYLREMYDAFGAPAFLAAYNAGPSRLTDYLENHRALPDETRRYVWLIGSMIQGIYPQSRSPNEQLALNEIPVAIPPGLRHPRPVYASARTRRHAHEAQIRLASLQQHRKAAAAPAATAPVEVAEAPEPKSAPLHLASAAPVHLASATTPHGHGGMHLIPSAYAAESVRIGGTNWAVQVGAFPSRAKAAAAASSASGMVSHASTAVAAVQSGRATVYRARLSGLTHDAAVHACQKLAHKSGGCLIVSPASQ